MTGEEIVALARKHSLFEFVAQGTVDPIPVARAKGVYFWTPEGKRFIDYTLVRWNYFFTNPPLSISEVELREAFAIIDRGLAMTDRAVG